MDNCNPSHITQHQQWIIISDSMVFRRNSVKKLAAHMEQARQKTKITGLPCCI